MTTLAENFRTLITSATTITTNVGDRVHANRMPVASQYPAIFFIRSSAETDRDFDGATGPTRSVFDTECLTDDTGPVEAIELAEDVRILLDGYSGAMGTTTVQGIFVTDKDDDYLPRGNASDEGIHVVALDVIIWH